MPDFNSFNYYYIFKYSAVNLCSMSFSWDFISGFFLGAPEYKSVRAFSEATESGGDLIFNRPGEHFVVEKHATKICRSEEFEPWESQNNHITRLFCDDLLPVGKINTTKYMEIDLKQRKIRGLYVGDTFISRKGTPEWMEAGEMNCTHPWLLTRPKVFPRLTIYGN